MKKETFTTILLFAALFMVIGTIAPMLFYSYAPQSHFINEHSFHAENASPGDEHRMQFDRTIHQRSSGTVFVELYLVDDSGRKVEVLSKNEDRYFQQGRRVVYDDVQLPNDIEEGRYRYERVYRMRLYNGRVERIFTFESEPFYVE